MAGAPERVSCTIRATVCSKSVLSILAWPKESREISQEALDEWGMLAMTDLSAVGR
jgi:hypothetical protein